MLKAVKQFNAWHDMKAKYLYDHADAGSSRAEEMRNRRF